MRVVRHPDYNKLGKLENDVALILFENPGFEITSWVRPICLWNEAYDFSLIEGADGVVNLLSWFLRLDHSNLKLKIFGWDEPGNLSNSKKLLEETMKIENYKDCYLAYPKLYGFFLRPGENFCAKGKGRKKSYIQNALKFEHFSTSCRIDAVRRRYGQWFLDV
jgi:hypothetical protein